ncbi:MAG: 2-C-methyl-D-erythritol 4-phosphate cytidylyltransferase [Bacilli bacterium]|nr:2-C-methyl-D-erythritol 4-phosphate cytidylyltransferase [Bacilli bacterium]
MANIAVIPIGGVGKRMQNEIPKQFITINDKPLYMYTLEKIQNNNKIDKIIIACLKDYKDKVINECKEKNISKVMAVVSDGETQLGSLFNCFEFLNGQIKDDDKILIHVGNRPNITGELIDRCLDSYDEVGPLAATIPAVEVMINKDTREIIPRNDIVRIQTPQVFAFKDIKELIPRKNEYKFIANTMCDLFIKLDKRISFIDGDLMNFKITYPEDLELFKKIIS